MTQGKEHTIGVSIPWEKGRKPNPRERHERRKDQKSKLPATDKGGDSIDGGKNSYEKITEF